MKIAESVVLSTDWHLSFSQQFDRLDDDGISVRLKEIIDSVNWVVSTGKKKKAKYFLGLGDIFDRAEKLQTKEGLLIKNMFHNISTSFEEKIFIPGNHDQISANNNILDLFKPDISVFSKFNMVDTKYARFFFLPYLREVEDIYAAIDAMKKYDCPAKKYLFAHFWDSSVMGIDPDAVDLSKIDLSFFDRIFCGHYHVPTNNLSSKVIYLGTLLNKKFNETGPKGCWILDTQNNNVEFIVNPHSPEFFSTSDTVILTSEELPLNAYYRVYCDPLNMVEVSKRLSPAKGMELLYKKEDSNGSILKVSIDTVEKKNSQTLKDYILNNCKLFIPEGISEEEFKQKGLDILSGL